MNQETLLKANAELYGTLTIIGGVLDGYVDHEMDNGRQPNANLGVAAGLATKVLNDVEKLFDEAAAPEFEYTMEALEAAAKARLEDIKTAEEKGAFDALAYMATAVLRDADHPNKSLGLVIHTKSGFNHQFATRQFCRLCDNERTCECSYCQDERATP